MTKTENIKIKLSKQFAKQFDRAPIKIQQAIRQRLKLFLQNPNSVQLHNHALTGVYKGYRSINITGDWRAIFVYLRKKKLHFLTRLVLTASCINRNFW